MNKILVEVSIGELLDKISILEFKEFNNVKRDKLIELLYDIEIKMIDNLVHTELNLKKLPSKAFSTYIENISFQDKEMGTFSIFNAFFLNDFVIQ